MALPYWQVSNCTTTSNFVFDKKSCAWTSSDYLARSDCGCLVRSYNQMLAGSNFTPMQRIERNSDKQGYHYNASVVGATCQSNECAATNLKYNHKPSMQFIGTDGTFGPGSKGDAFVIPCKPTVDRCGCDVVYFTNPEMYGSVGSTISAPSALQEAWTYNTKGAHIYDGTLFHCNFQGNDIPEITGRGWQGTNSEIIAAVRLQDRCIFDSAGCFNYGNVTGLMYYASSSQTNSSVWNAGYGFTQRCTCCTCQKLCLTLKASSITPEDYIASPGSPVCTTKHRQNICFPDYASGTASSGSIAFGGEKDSQYFWMYVAQSGSECRDPAYNIFNCCCRAAQLIRMKAPSYSNSTDTCFTQECSFMLTPENFGCNPANCWSFTNHVYAICNGPANTIYGKGETYPFIGNNFRVIGGTPSACCGRHSYFANNWILNTSDCSFKTIHMHMNGCPTPVDIEYTSRGTWLLAYFVSPGCAPFGSGYTSCSRVQFPIAVAEYSGDLTTHLGTIPLMACICGNSVSTSSRRYGQPYQGHKITYDHVDDSFLLGVNFGGVTNSIFGSTGRSEAGAAYARLPANLQTYCCSYMRMAKCRARYCSTNYCICTTGINHSPANQDSYGQAKPTHMLYPFCNICGICMVVCCTTAACCNQCYTSSMCMLDNDTTIQCRAVGCACTSNECCSFCHCRYWNEACNVVGGQVAGGVKFTRILDFY